MSRRVGLSKTDRPQPLLRSVQRPVREPASYDAPPLSSDDDDLGVFPEEQPKKKQVDLPTKRQVATDSEDELARDQPNQPPARRSQTAAKSGPKAAGRNISSSSDESGPPRGEITGTKFRSTNTLSQRQPTPPRRRERQAGYGGSQGTRPSAKAAQKVNASSKRSRDSPASDINDDILNPTKRPRSDGHRSADSPESSMPESLRPKPTRKAQQKYGGSNPTTRRGMFPPPPGTLPC